MVTEESVVSAIQEEQAEQSNTSQAQSQSQPQRRDPDQSQNQSQKRDEAETGYRNHKDVDGALLSESSPEKQFSLVELPTSFDPDAEPVSPRPIGPSPGQEDDEDVLRVPIVTAEDEEKAAAAEREREDGEAIGGENWIRMITGLAEADGDGDADADAEGEGMDGIEEALGDGDGEGEGEGEIGEEIVAEQPDPVPTPVPEKEPEIPSGKYRTYPTPIFDFI